ncbi:MAG: glutamate synthase [Polyangiaceae bacterium]|nr:glutamate synthase [Polyangiaceae bacterium]
MFREMDTRQSIFDLPSRKFFVSTGHRNLEAIIHGQRAPVPLGPAAGPHTQLAPNIVLSYLAGGRVIELKTVQVKDDLDIPRPCIDMTTVGYNVEWSQELRIAESLEEYAKAALAIAILAESGIAKIAQPVRGVLFEASIGYDLAGIESEKVDGFLRRMCDASPVIDKLRHEIPRELQRYRDVDVPSRLAAGITLSTFHGCPPGQIERIAQLIMSEYGLAVTIKLNPTLLGKNELLRLLHGELGYHDVEVPDAAFDSDAKWDDVVSMIGRLSNEAAARGLGFGIKLTNTLVVKNTRAFFPKDIPEAYLSGPPLHVLAVRLSARIREAVGMNLPISFSAGIDWSNFADAVALDFAPVTVCTDWLKPGGYGRAHRYFEELFRRMDAVGAATRGDWIIRAHGHGRAALAALALDADTEARCARALDEKRDLLAASGDAYDRWVREAARRNTQSYAEGILASGRYHRNHHDKPPKKLGTKLHLFDCITCDKCIPVCPNDANFTLAAGHTELPIVKAHREGTAWVFRRSGLLRLDEKHQIGCFADHCNECGNCDIFCPEDGGPYRMKPRFYGSIASFSASTGDGVYVERSAERDLVLGRFDDAAFRLEARHGKILFEGNGFRVTFSEHDPEGTIEGIAAGEVDLTWYGILNLLRNAVLSQNDVNWVSCLWEKDA